jgi:hypothetical protein
MHIVFDIFFSCIVSTYLVRNLSPKINEKATEYDSRHYFHRKFSLEINKEIL